MQSDDVEDRNLLSLKDAPDAFPRSFKFSDLGTGEGSVTALYERRGHLMHITASSKTCFQIKPVAFNTLSFHSDNESQK